MDLSFVTDVWSLIKDHKLAVSFITLFPPVSVTVGSFIFSRLRRPKKVTQGSTKYFDDKKLLIPPQIKRPAYSDRMAYVLAELSALAYLEFEKSGKMVQQAAWQLAGIASRSGPERQRWLKSFAEDIMLKGINSEEFLRRHLKDSQFKLLGTINVEETQGFVCKRVAAIHRLMSDRRCVVSHRKY